MTVAPTHPSAATAIGAVRHENFAYQRSPMIVYWELTTACGLACRHCRAEAVRQPLPGELTTRQALAVLDQIQGFGDPLPHVVMTGGDPLRRADLDLLIDAATERGIGVSLAPAVTPLLNRDRLEGLRESGVQAISLSLDGSTPALHDGVRQVPGTFEATMELLDVAAAVGMPVQVNTLVTADTIGDMPAIFELLRTRTLMTWSLFFLISTGRGTQLQEPSPGETEKLMRWLLGIAREAPFMVRTTEATHYRRVAAMRHEKAGRTAAEIEALPMARSFGIRDGNGIVFISHLGDVTPSGFLPLAVGNVKERSIVDLYRDDPTMRALRDPAGFTGRCGDCEYHLWCGGSRARAYAHTGDPLESDPLCPYQPGSRTVAL
ncbi:Radical SAM domain protein [Xylanimonas cellulosilytica DSM 15894]|uniref:Radical SAM domain protein n=1 Tax=Xylanimonas cellulosilytica (strain DSM 15894 / JCM 12276 / CECT 5975 / KCTC 9989 / LMG 20990 / NBRC 107835 / XIL07) TaxID=446471 RepID=D1BZZ8_XYLCX|nr:TIGR04053 family radical SAM/SPASM domain-containing protein [Xylanimonas cellulosilytica]ACZ32126.1 Radical SAM domain protein [Xylanimonas cellulosilytica DSM 15894]